MKVSTDDEHDVKTMPDLGDKAERNMQAARTIGDGAYHSGNAYDLLEAPEHRAYPPAEEEQQA